MNTPTEELRKELQLARERIEVLLADLEAANHRVAELEQLNTQLRCVGDELYDLVQAPEPNCSCHLSPPCNDCVEHGGAREIKDKWKALR